MNLQLVYQYIFEKKLKKNENMFYEKTKTKQKDQKIKSESFQRRESNPGPSTCEVNALSIEPRQLTLSIFVKLIIVNTFPHEILPVEAV